MKDDLGLGLVEMGAAPLNKAEAASAAFLCLIVSGEADLEVEAMTTGEVVDDSARLLFLSSIEAARLLEGVEIVAADAKAKDFFPFANS